MATRLTGWDAIELAKERGYLLSLHAEGAEPVQSDVDVATATRVAKTAPDRVYLDIDEIAPGDTRIA